MNYIVISDLHIGDSDSLAIFHAQRELARFLQSLGKEPITLVINGDAFDFLAVKPDQAFNRNAATAKIQAIVETPANLILWEGFRGFLALNLQNRIEILLGNHDLELIFEPVQEILRGVLAAPGEGERVRFETDNVTYLNFRVGNVPIHLEHGFQFDVFNWYDHNSLLGATLHGADGSAFKLPAGSRLVYDVLNRLTPEHPFVPLLKPELGVFYILLALAPRETLRHIKSVSGFAAGTLINGLRSRLTGMQFDPTGNTGDLAALPLEPNQPLELARLNARLLNMSYDDNLDEETVESIGELIAQDGSEAQAFGVFSDLARKGRNYLLRRGLNALLQERNDFFDPQARDSFQPALDKILDLGAGVAIMGHSHARKITKLASGGRSLWYLNTGTWADLLDFDPVDIATDEALEGWLNSLQTRDFTPTLIFTCARLVPLDGERGVRVSLEEWRDGRLHTIGSPQEIMAD